jgi:hypothetical protein
MKGKGRFCEGSVLVLEDMRDLVLVESLIDMPAFSGRSRQNDFAFVGIVAFILHRQGLKMKNRFIMPLDEHPLERQNAYPIPS